jgi:hypothetical protein
LRRQNKKRLLNGSGTVAAIVLAVILAGVSVPAFPDDTGRGREAGAAFRMGLGARELGMGGGYAALADDACAAYVNPAGLVWLDRRWFTATARSMALDRKFYSLGYAQSLGGKNGLMKAGFSLGWLCAGVDNIDLRDFDGNPAGTLSQWEHDFYFSFAVQPVPMVSLGMTAKVLYNRFPDLVDEGTALSAVGFGFDLGVAVRPISSLRIGLSVKDIGSKYTWDTQDLYEQGTQTIDRFPRIVIAGMAWCGLGGRLLAAMDAEQVEFHPVAFRAGMEFKVVRGIDLRIGTKAGEWTFGAGIGFSIPMADVRLDYAFVEDPAAPRPSHVFSWSFLF